MEAEALTNRRTSKALIIAHRMLNVGEASGSTLTRLPLLLFSPFFDNPAFVCCEGTRFPDPFFPLVLDSRFEASERGLTVIGCHNSCRLPRNGITPTDGAAFAWKPQRPIRLSRPSAKDTKAPHNCISLSAFPTRPRGGEYSGFCSLKKS